MATRHGANCRKHEAETDFDNNVVDPPLELRPVQIVVGPHWPKARRVNTPARPVQQTSAALFALRKPDGEWAVCQTHEDPLMHEAMAFRTFDEAAAERHAMESPEWEIVPLIELSEVLKQYHERTSEDDETPEPEQPDDEENTGTPLDVDALLAAVANETQWLIELVQGLHEADSTRETIERIKDDSRIMDEGMQGLAPDLRDRPLRDILGEDHIYLPDDDARSCVLYLGNVIEARLKIMHKVVSAVRERNIIGTPEGLADCHRRLED